MNLFSNRKSKKDAKFKVIKSKRSNNATGAGEGGDSNLIIEEELSLEDEENIITSNFMNRLKMKFNTSKKIMDTQNNTPTKND